MKLSRIDGELKKPAQPLSCHSPVLSAPETGKTGETLEVDGSGQSISFFRGQCRVSIANRFESRHLAYRFQHRTYVKSGIIPPKTDGLWVTTHDALPETTTFLAHDIRGELAGTLTLVFDSAIDLPADKLFPSEMNAVRKGGGRVCELISFGTNENMRGSVKILAGLLYCSYLFALHARKVSDYVITVHERYQTFYCANLLFSRMGPVRNYDKVNGQPTVLLHLPLDLPETLRQSRRIFPLSLFNYSQMQELTVASLMDRMTSPMTAQEIRFFLMEQTDIWRKSTSAEKEFIQAICASGDGIRHAI